MFADATLVATNGPTRQPAIYIAWIKPSQRCAPRSDETNVLACMSLYARPRLARKKATAYSGKGGGQARSTWARIWVAAPSDRMVPRSRCWHMKLLDRAAKNQPKKVVPYLRRFVSIVVHLWRQLTSLRQCSSWCYRCVSCRELESPDCHGWCRRRRMRRRRWGSWRRAISVGSGHLFLTLVAWPALRLVQMVLMSVGQTSLSGFVCSWWHV